ncbi:methionyl-tRNA formyltransferase [Halalkalibaculum sp. DA384]|uniref:methionyl-tRNA formyltransferase n=1 Tax=Halalkalibaculum sp. DA384 TaxID=3373606 RepID=UPI0037545EB9
MRILFIGSVQFSEKALEKLIELNTNLVGVVTKERSDFNADFVDLSKLAVDNNIPYHYTNDVNSTRTISWIQKKQPDVIFCLGWSQLLKEKVLSIPPKGAVGYHPSKLPHNRGRHPLIWAVALGLRETGSTFFIMNKGADTGDVISQKLFPIHFEDKAIDVYKRMTTTATGQLEEIIEQFETGNIHRIPQDSGTGNSWRKRGKDDGKIDFRMSSEAIYNLVRALSKPYVGAHFEYKGKDVKVWDTKVGKKAPKNIEPGKVLDVDNRKILVKTGDMAIWLTEHKLDEMPQKGEYLL